MVKKKKSIISDRFAFVMAGFLHVNRPIETKEDAIYWLKEFGMPIINDKAHSAIDKYLKKRQARKLKEGSD